MHDVIIVGGGLAGLSCARHLQRAGRRFLLLEASDGLGGRVRTDRVDGFLLDRGFQVFLAAYPEAGRLLDLRALDLKPFLPGALVRHGGAFHQVADPWRRPLQGLRSAFTPIGSLADKLRVVRLRSRVLGRSVEDLFDEPEATTLQALTATGFSASMIERFFRPFLGGIFLEPDLRTSSRMFHFVFRMFSLGDACVPAAGMEAIPRQLAAALPGDAVRLNARVTRVEPGRVALASGEELRADAVVVATDGPAASGLLGEGLPAVGCGVTCLYFAAERAPLDAPVLVLNGEGRGPVNNLCVPDLVAPSYAPGSQSLISATVLGVAGPDDDRLLRDVRDQLTGWFGSDVSGWRHLRTYRIPYALPSQVPPALTPPARPVAWRPGVYVCGDHRDHASIEGALVSGRRAADAALAGPVAPGGY